MIASHKKVTFISKHDVFQCSAVQLLCFLAHSYLFFFCFVGQQLLFDRPNGFHPFHDKTLSHCTCTNLGPNKGKISPQIKARFPGVQLALPYYENIFSRGCFALPSAFSFPLWCCCPSFGNLFYHPRDSGLDYILMPCNFSLRQLRMLP